MGDTKLTELAQLHGVEVSYQDVWGRRREATAETLRAILGALRVDASTPEKIAEAIAQHESTLKAQFLPPVIVVPRGALADGAIMQLPSRMIDQALSWRVTEESGRIHDAVFSPRQLQRIEQTGVNGRKHRARILPLPSALPLGYHVLELLDEAGRQVALSQLIIVPERCYQPDALTNGERIWGAAVQLYSVRSAGNWGMGDFGDLQDCVNLWGSAGADILGVNPLHALFLHQPESASPYSPSSRRFLNALYLDIAAIEDFGESPAAQQLAASPDFEEKVLNLRASEFVDYAGVNAVKRSLLELLHANFHSRHLGKGTDRAGRFSEYRRAQGIALKRYALFEAIQEYLQSMGVDAGGWQGWPEAYRDPDSATVARFAVEHVKRIEFFEYLQWQADLQLATAKKHCVDLQMKVGLYVDLAVSVDGGGAEVWADQSLYSESASVGAPPDEFTQNGQDWGLPPVLPQRLRDTAYTSFIATLRANMRHAGALRIDHVMGLARLYWIPRGVHPSDGTYVRYPFQEMLGILALESHRHRCLVIGEDLGTVPDEMRAALQHAGVLSYRLLLFERGDNEALSARAPKALVGWSTHDLPTMAGYWRGEDLSVRGSLGLLADSRAVEAAVESRGHERAELALLLERSGLLPSGAAAQFSGNPQATPDLILALHAFIAQSAAPIMITQFEDVLGVLHQANLPGTVNEYPNLRRKLPLSLELWSADPRFRDLTAKLRSVRGEAATVKASERRITGSSIPRATYRIQLHSGFTFNDATALVPYLAELGISHVYCSPFLRAKSGSTHGYDIIDHTQLNPEIGTREAYDAFVAALTQFGMSQMADVVPNHMSVLGTDNTWWVDVLENGPASAYGDFFDIDWQPVSPDLNDRVLVPVLGDHYSAVLDRGELALQFESDEGVFRLRYNEHHFPIDPREYPRILQRAVTMMAETAAASDYGTELTVVIAAFAALPGRSERATERLAVRRSEKETCKRSLAGLATRHAEAAALITAAAHSFNGRRGDSASFDDLHQLLEAQAYRLAYWRVAADEINYRRFFDINELAALCMDNPAVFAATHQQILSLLQTGAVSALRIDHPDGLFDPAAYFENLQNQYRRLHVTDEAVESATDRSKPLYVVVEKIVASFEHIPESWAVHGTTGYRFANLVNGLFVDVAAERRMTRIYQSFTDVRSSFDDIAIASKRLILSNALASELTVLANQLARIARASRETRDYTLNSLRRALAEVIASFPVYRTYIADAISESDRRYIEWAIVRATRHSHAGDISVFGFIKSVLLYEVGPGDPSSSKAAMRRFARKFQQLTAPVMAKGVEDTSFYIYNRLVSLNDVGGSPASFGCSVRAFHFASAERAAKWPHTMLATSTHDNKRSEDVRARIDVLSEFAPAWRLQLRRWRRMNRIHRRKVDGTPAPSNNDEYLLYQTLIGSFPLATSDDPELAGYCERVEQYMLKAVREAKVHTSWMNPNQEYEGAIAFFVRALLASGKNQFLEDFRTAMAPLAWLGMLNSLSMVLIKYTSPGVPDCYQGNELWDFSLVDPDNRRPVDYARRQALLADLKATMQPDDQLAIRVRALFDAADDGRAKLYLVWRLLGLRQAHSNLFCFGDYTPIHASGKGAAHIIAYARRYEGGGLIAIAGRLYAGLGVLAGILPCGPDLWGDTHVALPFLADGTSLRNVLTGEVHSISGGGLSVANACANFPGAVFEYREQESIAS